MIGFERGLFMQPAASYLQAPPHMVMSVKLAPAARAAGACEYVVKGNSGGLMRRKGSSGK